VKYIIGIAHRLVFMFFILNLLDGGVKIQVIGDLPDRNFGAGEILQDDRKILKCRKCSNSLERMQAEI
jgi:hypothetical protein